MNAHAAAESSTLESAIDAIIEWLDDRDARREIIDRYLLGWLTAEHALQILIDLNLVEFSPGARSS